MITKKNNNKQTREAGTDKYRDLWADKFHLTVLNDRKLDEKSKIIGDEITPGPEFNDRFDYDSFNIEKTRFFSTIISIKTNYLFVNRHRGQRIECGLVDIKLVNSG